MKTILLDTNALMAVATWKIDVVEELKKTADLPDKVAVLEGTIQELQKIAQERTGKERRAAKLAIALLNAKCVPSIPGRGNVDDLLVDYSRKGYLVLTQDRELKKRLSRPYLTIRQKKKVVVIS